MPTRLALDLRQLFLRERVVIPEADVRLLREGKRCVHGSVLPRPRGDGMLPQRVNAQVAGTTPPSEEAQELTRWHQYDGYGADDGICLIMALKSAATVVERRVLMVLSAVEFQDRDV